ncbi:MAG TPA: S8 family serine peptidase [Polyangiaceae bacterium]
MGNRYHYVTLLPLMGIVVSACNGETSAVKDEVSVASQAVSASTSDNRAEVARRNARAAEAQKADADAQRIADRYIVVFRPGVVGKTSGATIQDVATRVRAKHGGTVTHQYQHAIRGLAMKLSKAERDSIAQDPDVSYIVPDGIATAVVDQSNATWGIDRIDQRGLPLNQTYSYVTDGTGVHAYVIDTGITAAHTEFGNGPSGASRVAAGYDAIDGDTEPVDCNGHGTHVAGTIAGTTYGVAKQATIHSVRVLDCGGSGTWSQVIAGIDWVTANHISPAVANMSLGGSFNQAVNDAVTNSIASGVTYGVAAGNSSADACSYSPASAPNALTVGATDSTDTRASYSNYGTCVDIFAPGTGVTSSWYTSVTATNTISGTSMATPHVVGVSALYLGLNPTATPAQVASLLRSRATQGVVLSPGTGSPNRLLYAGNLNAPTDLIPPTAAITTPQDGTAVSGIVTVNAAASDNSGTVVAVELRVNGSTVSTDTTAPYDIAWDTGNLASGSYVLTVTASDDSGNAGTSAPVTVTLDNPGLAAYNPTYSAPACTGVRSSCSTGNLIDGRGAATELHTPNTLYSSCADGTSGTYHYDESLDRLRVYTLDGTNIAPGKTVRIEATVWSWSANGADNLDLYYAPDASSPSWNFLTTYTAMALGAITVVSDFVMPAGGGTFRAIRGNFRYSTSAEACTVGNYDDRDDLVFAVDSGTPPVNQAPAISAGPDVSVILPATATLDGTVSDDGLPNPPAVVTTTWSVVSGPGTVGFANPNAVDTTATFSTAGTYVLRLTGNDGALSTSDDVTITVAQTNAAPFVNAGPDLAVTLPAAATLDGTIADDGLPNPPGTVTTTWAALSGPGTVTFGNPNAVDTTATFSAAGTYVLRLTADDGALFSSDTVTIVVTTVANVAPVVNAGADQTITLPANASLVGTVSDDGLPAPPNLTLTWSKTSGPGTVTFAPANAASTTVSFSAAGLYVLRLTANDGVLSTSDEVQVTVNPAAGTNPCAGLCNSPVAFTVNGSYQSGNLGANAVCYETKSVIHGGNCGNFVTPRTLSVNGTVMSCSYGNWSTLPAVRNGGYCIQTTAGNYTWAYFSAW